MSETVIRVRSSAPGRDDNDDPLPDTEPQTPLVARAVAPGNTLQARERARNGEDIDYAVYFTEPVDITDDDELIVRGNRGKVRVQEWRSAFSSRVGIQVNVTVDRG